MEITNKQSSAKLHLAKRIKNNEFYTPLEAIKKEISYYIKFSYVSNKFILNPFENKTIFLNCDDPEHSQFWFYFSEKFNWLKIKKLIATHYKDKPYAISIERDKNGNKGEVKKIELKENGDFRSNECIEFLKESDVVVTNPPFSFFREYIKQLMFYNKKFLIIGNKLAIHYKDIFPLLRDSKIWIGRTFPKNFIQPDGTRKKVPAIWYTNLENGRQNEYLKLYKKYKGSENLYVFYDNYNAINVDRTREIPCDYNGVMGVPLTFIINYNPKQFKIVGFRYGDDNKTLAVNGKNNLFTRILIRKVDENGI